MESAAESKRERRPHRKSRLGCLACKQRKVKCDESRPICLNCVRREIDCKFPKHDSTKHAGESPSTSTGQATLQSHHVVSFLESSLNNQKPKLDEPISVLTYDDMALMHHYFNMPDKTPGDEELLQASLHHPHLLHLILGFSALHWSRLELDRRDDLVAQADRHYTIGMRGATELIGGARQETQEDMALVYRSAILIGVYNLALGPQPGEYIGFSDHNGGVSFLVYLRGIQIIGENKEGKTKSTAPEAPDTPNPEIQSCDMEVCAQDNISGSSTGYGTHIEQLRCLARACRNDLLNSTSKDTSIYLTAINQLEPFFKEIYDFQPETCPTQGKSVDPHSRVAFAWLYRVSSGFINRLQEKETLALAIFACFALILKKLETGWVVEGWPEHIMSGVWKFLGPEWRGLVEWPMQEMGLEHLDGGWTASHGFV
ncbi:hypothetical protein BKA61DRAFT_467817 [Leptodontidium sp. MPI-SDFR-AT-0119]|nr:hypothetical protein BKA61DRAFT_467817 [Leptodontidium sp. MPI-SDFR-AT-0119]